MIETTWDDPDWVIAASDTILRESLCVASLPCDPGSWYERTDQPPCYPGFTRFWKTDPLVDLEGTVIRIVDLGSWPVDGLFVRGALEFQLYQDLTGTLPFGPSLFAPQYVTPAVWNGLACDGFEPGTFFADGGLGALDGYSLTLAEFTVAPIEGGVRATQRIDPAFAQPVPQLLVDGVAADDVRVYGSAQTGFSVFYTPPPHAAGLVDVTMFDGVGFQVVGNVQYTADVVRGVVGTRRGVEVAFEELLQHRPDDFPDDAPGAGARAEVVLHGVLRRAATAAADPVERAALGVALEEFLTRLRDAISGFVAEDGLPRPNFPAPVVRPPTWGQALHYPFTPSDDVVLLTLATGTLALSPGTTPVPGGEQSGGRVVLPTVDKLGAFYTEAVAAPAAHGWSFTVEVDATGGAGGVQIRDAAVEPTGGGTPLGVASLLSFPTLLATVDGVPQTFALSEADLGHVYVNETVVSTPPVEASATPVPVTQWLLAAVYRINLDGSPHTDNTSVPALVVRQTYAFSAPFDETDPDGCREQVQFWPRVSVSVSIPPGTPLPPVVEDVRVDERIDLGPLLGSPLLPGNQYVAGFFRDALHVDWFLAGCVPVPLWFNAYSFRSLAWVADGLPAETVAPVALESLAFSGFHDAFLMHHVDPDAGSPWSGFGVEPTVEAPGNAGGGVRLRWRWADDYGAEFGGGASLMPDSQEWVMALTRAGFPEDPSPDFETVLRADLLAPGAADIEIADKVLFVGAREAVVAAGRQIETHSPGFSFVLGPAASSCSLQDWIAEYGGYPGLQLDPTGVLHAVLLNTLQATQQAFRACALEAPPLLGPGTFGSLCEDVAFPAGSPPAATPLVVVAGATTVTFDAVPASGTFEVDPNLFTTSRGYVLAQPEAPGGIALEASFSPAVRAVRRMPVVVDDGVGPAGVSVELFDGPTSLGTFPLTAVVAPGATLAEGTIDLDPGQTFDRMTVTPDDPSRALAVGPFQVCSAVIAAGDLNRDGLVDAGDLTVLSACAAGSGVGIGFECSDADLDDDGDVDCDDLTLLDGLVGGGLGALPDGDSDGVPDACDNCPGEANALQADCDGDGIGDACALLNGVSADCNSNGIPDDCDVDGGGSSDCNENWIPDECEPDCNTNGVPDECDIVAGTSTDCGVPGVAGSGNGIPDECEPDCNTNGMPDSCDVLAGTSADCNGNGVPDECDLAAATSVDCNLNGVLDECELTGHDCNANGQLDECDIALGISIDCNANGYPDECEPDCDGDDVPDACDLDCNGNLVSDKCDIFDGTSLDCNVNGVPDECDLVDLTSPDCNFNGIPDECDVMFGPSADCNTDGIPDECQLFLNDCNEDGVPDECQLAGNDCNADLIPDDCQLVGNDCNADGIPDECQIDCNSNGVPDDCDITAGTSTDCNNNAIPDDCETLSVIYVDDTAAGADNGSSWGDAFTDLQEALASSATCQSGGPVQVWVAAGTYLATEPQFPVDPRTSHFLLVDDVAVYGGFAGGETELGQRDFVANVVVLTADRNGDDGPGMTNTSDNNYHVVVANGVSATAVLDGFTLRAGNANAGATENQRGGGLLNRFGGSPAIANCIFLENEANFGGGLYNEAGGAPTLTGCSFDGNSANNQGGALSGEAGAVASFTLCTFTGNSGNEGGVGFLPGSSPEFTNCDFDGNSSPNDGGAFSMESGASPGFDGCTFTSNGGSSGGAVLIDASSPIFLDTDFTTNTATIFGGGVSCLNGSAPSFTDCDFTGNSSNSQGGAFYVSGASVPDLDGCMLVDNTAIRGAGMQVIGSSPTLELCVFDGNDATAAGGAMSIDTGSSPVLSVCNFLMNTAVTNGGAINNGSGSTPSFIGCQFVSNSAGSFGGAMHSSNSSNPDATGCGFVMNMAGTQGGGVSNASGTAPSYSLCLFSGNTALRGGGMININADPTVDDCTFTGNNGSAVGGGMSNELGSSPVVTNSTFDLNTSQLGAGMFVDGNGSDAAVSGCDFTSNSSVFFGGGLYVSNGANPTVSDSTFDDNDAVQQGGGVYNAPFTTVAYDGCTFVGNDSILGAGMFNANADPTLTDCTFEANVATGDAGGVGNNGSSSSPLFVRCTFRLNQAVNGAGAQNAADAGGTYEECQFYENAATQFGGALQVIGNATGVLRNCMIGANTATRGAGVFVNFGTSATLAGCTLADNASVAGGGLYLPGIATVTNSVFWGNSDSGGTSEEAQIRLIQGATLNLDYTCVEGLTGGFGGTGNIGLDPLFADPLGNDFHLTSASPCREAGDPGFVPAPDELDVDGEERVQGALLDMGADEYHDCDAAGGADYLQVLNGTVLDCNGNGIPDACDIAGGASLDANGDGFPDECVLLSGDVPSIPLGAGGSQLLTLTAGAEHAGRLYWLLGSASGVFPGVPGPPPIVVPLVFDAYFVITLSFPNLPPLANSLNFLDAAGSGIAAVTFPAGSDPTLAGVILNHAYAVVDFPGSGAVVLASNAVAVELVP